jgi:hypothetical protein
MAEYRHHSRREQAPKISKATLLGMLWHSFWDPPEEACPKCGNAVVEYYDPFFFSPIRTLKGRRRIRCKLCHFIWRPSRKGRAVWDFLGIKF